jgi:DNA-binding MarR family transcriptional regulator
VRRLNKLSHVAPPYSQGAAARCARSPSTPTTRAKATPKTPPILSAAELSAAALNTTEVPAVEPSVTIKEVDTSFLESLMGYNARRASVAIIERFLREMAVYDLRPVDFSVMSLIIHNPGITSRQLCAALGLLPPNLVGMVNTLQKRALIERRAHPTDGRALGLHPSAQGRQLMQSAEQTAARLEARATARLTPSEAKTLKRLLQKIYL